MSPTVYPIVPGHEIVAHVTKVGSAVTKYQPGDLVGAGCMVDSDGTCAHSKDGLEQFCPDLTLTYNSPDKHLGRVPYGGYSESIIGLRLGAHEVVVSRNTDEMQQHAGSFDFILDRVSADHDINAYINLLRRDGTITLVGAPPRPLGVSAFALITGGRSLSGSNIGGIAETQELLNFCGAHHITADVEVIPIQKVNEAYDRMLKSDVKYRFSINLTSLKSESGVDKTESRVGVTVG